MLNRDFPLEVSVDRFRKLSFPSPERVAAMLAIPDLHRALLACAAMITCHVLQPATVGPS